KSGATTEWYRSCTYVMVFVGGQYWLLRCAAARRGNCWPSRAQCHPATPDAGTNWCHSRGIRQQSPFPYTNYFSRQVQGCCPGCLARLRSHVGGHYLPVYRFCRDRFVHCVVHAPISWRQRRPGICVSICVLYWRRIWHRYRRLSCSSVAAYHHPPVGICACCTSARRTATNSGAPRVDIHRPCFNCALRAVFTACNAGARLLAESHGHSKW